MSEMVFGEERDAVVELISHAESLGFDVSRDGDLWSLRDRRNHQTAVSGSIRRLRQWLDDGCLGGPGSSVYHLTIPRSILEAMPAEWQSRFVQCLEELDNDDYWGDEVLDPLANYRYPDQEEIRRRRRSGQSN